MVERSRHHLMFVFKPYYFLLSLRKFFVASFVASHSYAIRSFFSSFIIITLLSCITNTSSATNYIVSDKTNLQNKMNAAVPGDTVIVANGTYNWGQISFTNNNGTSTSAWIVLKAETFRGVVFNGSTYLGFKGTHVKIDGFRFADGNAGSNAVISFRSSSSNLSNYCRITNIIVDNYNSAAETDNEWVALYGTNNRVDHCTFINKSNVRATVVVWYSTTTYPNPAVSTYHLIDSNYFKGRSYMGSNGGETIRVGDSNASRTDAYNTIESNLFENCTQDEPEIISNKSDFNIYRYNTFKNSHGGLTLRHGRYCSVYSNFFIVDDAAVTEAYGVRVIDKGHKVFNNYFEGVNGNSGSLTSARAPICLYNGLSATTDTTDATKASGYFPADSSIVAFNTIINAKGGAGIILGYIDGGANTFQPLGLKISNNLIKMTTGQTAYLAASNTSLTYSAEGNIYQAPSGLGLSSSTGFTSATLTFGSRTNGILTPPSLVQDAAANTANYISLLNSIDAQGQTRGAVYDVGADEINGTGSVIYYPLDSNLVGAGKPSSIMPVQLIRFSAVLSNDKVLVSWQVENEVNFLQYEVELSKDGRSFEKIGTVTANNQSYYSFVQYIFSAGKNYYRLRLVDKDGRFSYSPTRLLNVGKATTVNVYPNPAKNIVVIELNGIINLQTVITLFDVSGKAVKKVSNITTNIIEMPVQQLQSGLYHLQIAEQGNIISNYPLIINK
jgi:poly(beta-D-mannuronate) lyase